MTILHNLHLTSIDALSDAPVDIVFADTITEIVPAADTTRPGHEVIDGAGRFLVPGLIDTHVHLGSPDRLTSAARAGVTTLIDLGTSPDSVVEQQRATSGAPSILSAGSAASAAGSTQIDAMGFPSESAVSDPADAERYLDWRTEKNSDLIKIIVEDPAATEVPALDIPTITALVTGAHERGLLTVAHVVTAAAFDRALDAGVDVLTHAPLDRPLAASTIQRMLEQKAIASPTLVMMHAMAGVLLGDGAEPAFGNALESVRRLHEAGVPVVVGTDANETPFAPVQHGPAVHHEIAYLQQAGLTAAEAFHAATGGAALAFGLGDRGLLQEGLRADLVLVDGDPRRDPEVLRTPAAVWIAGAAVS